MTSAFDRISDTLGPIGAGAIAGAAGAGGQFAFHPDEIQALVKDWLDLADSYESSLATARLLAAVIGPATDSASEMHADAASSSGRLYMESLQEKFHYSRGQAQKFQDALNAYLGRDQEAATRMLGTAPGSPEGGI